MHAASARTSAELLDAVQSRARLAEFDVETYAARLADEVAVVATDLDGLAARDQALAAALGHIDRFAQRAARIELEHALADETAVTAPFRATLAAGVVDVDAAVVRQRVQAVVARSAPGRAAAVADLVVAALDGATAVRDRLRGAVLTLAADLATEALAEARARAADPGGDDSARARWSCARQELEAVVAAPSRIAVAPWLTRIGGQVALDERPAMAEPSLGDLIELE